MFGAVLGGVLGALGSKGGKSTTTHQLSPEQRALIQAAMPTLLSYMNNAPQLNFDPMQLKGQQQMLGALPQMQRNYMDAASLLGGGSTSPPPNAAGALDLGSLIAMAGTQPGEMDIYARPKIEKPKTESGKKKSGSGSTSRNGGSDGWEAPGPGRGGIGFGPGRSGPGSGSDYGGPESNDPGRGSGFGGGGGNGNSGGGRASGGTGSRGSRN